MVKKLAILAAVAVMITALAACGSSPQYEDTELEFARFGGEVAIPDIHSIEEIFEIIGRSAETERYDNFRTFGGTIRAIKDGVVRLESREGQITEFRISENSAVLAESLRVGAFVTGVYDANELITFMFPPNRHAVALVDGTSGISVGRLTMNEFTNNLWMNFGHHSVRTTEKTVIVLQDGTPFDGEHSELIGCKAIAFYSIVAASFPSWATTNSVVVLCETAAWE